MGSVATRTLAQPARAGKHNSLFAVFDRQGKPVKRTRVNHEPGAIRAFLSQFPQATPVALETVGNWYWIVDEIEAAGCLPHLTHIVPTQHPLAPPARAGVRSGQVCPSGGTRGQVSARSESSSDPRTSRQP